MWRLHLCLASGAASPINTRFWGDSTRTESCFCFWFIILYYVLIGWESVMVENNVCCVKSDNCNIMCCFSTSTEGGKTAYGSFSTNKRKTLSMYYSVCFGLVDTSRCLKQLILVSKNKTHTPPRCAGAGYPWVRAARRDSFIWDELRWSTTCSVHGFKTCIVCMSDIDWSYSLNLVQINCTNSSMLISEEHSRFSRFISLDFSGFPALLRVG